MIDKICDVIINRINKKMPDVDEEKEEVIRYGLQLIIGEIPKMFIFLLISWALGILKYSIFSFLIILPYRLTAGGLHLKSHLGCILATTSFYMGNVYISKIINFNNFAIKLIFAILVLFFAIIMITLYAPADTEYAPILVKSERKKKKIYSYFVVCIEIIVSLFVKDKIISNMCIIGILLQTITISKLAYNICNVNLGYLEYIKGKKDAT